MLLSEVVLRSFWTLGETFWWIRWSSYQRRFRWLCSAPRWRWVWNAVICRPLVMSVVRSWKNTRWGLKVVQEVSWEVGSTARSRTRSWSVWSDWLRFQIESGDHSIAMWWTTGVKSCSPIDLWLVPGEPLDETWSFDGSFGVSDSEASLMILTDSLPLVVNEPLCDRFFSCD